MTWDHLLLTRLSVRLPDRAPPSEEWLHARLSLFERFCAPSVNAQADFRARWLLLHAAQTPQWFVDACADLVTVPHESVRLADPWSPMVARDVVAGHSTSPWLITSRVDSDDALGRRYTSAVRAAAEQHRTEDGPVFLNPLRGAQWTVRNVSLYSHPSNAFISCVEPRLGGAPTTVFVDGHDRVGRHGPLVQLRGTTPLWMQVVHDGNMLNGESGWPVPAARVLDHVVVNAVPPAVGGSTLVVARVRAIWMLVLRVLSRPSRLRWVPRYLVARTRRVRAR